MAKFKKFLLAEQVVGKAVERALAKAAGKEIESAGARSVSRAIERATEESAIRDAAERATQIAGKHYESGLRGDDLIDAIAKETGAGNDAIKLQAAIDASLEAERFPKDYSKISSGQGTPSQDLFKFDIKPGESFNPLKRYVNTAAERMKTTSPGMTTVTVEPSNVPTFDEIFREMHGKNWQSVASDTKAARENFSDLSFLKRLGMLNNPDDLAKFNNMIGEIPYPEFDKVVGSPRKVSELQINLDPSNRETLGSWLLDQPYGGVVSKTNPGYGILEINPAAIESGAITPFFDKDFQNTLTHEGRHAVGDIDWSTHPSSTLFYPQGRRTNAGQVTPMKHAIHIVNNPLFAPFFDPKTATSLERVVYGPKTMTPERLQDMAHFSRNYDYITPREFMAQAGDIQDALKNIGMDRLDTSKIFDRDYGIEAFRKLRKNYNIDRNPWQLLSPLLLEPIGRSLIAPVAKRDKIKYTDVARA